jgi:hypothetical protein
MDRGSMDRGRMDRASIALESIDLGSMDPDMLVEKVTEHFRAHEALSRDDFYNIAKRLRHS